jgi:hypothetical protein
MKPQVKFAFWANRWCVAHNKLIIYYAPVGLPLHTQWYLALDYANHLANLTNILERKHVSTG